MLVNMKTILLYHDRRVRPDLVEQIQEAIRTGADATAIACDPSEIDCFQTLTFFEPLPDELMEKLFASKPEARKARKKAAKKK